MNGLSIPASDGDGKRNPRSHSERSEESSQKGSYFYAVFFCVRMTDKIGKTYEIWKNEEAITGDLSIT